MNHIVQTVVSVVACLVLAAALILAAARGSERGRDERNTELTLRKDAGDVYPFVSSDDGIHDRVAPVFSTIRNWVANYTLAGIGLVLLTALVSASPLLVPAQATQILLVGATIEAAIGFHLYSIGNTIYSIATSIGAPEYFDDATTVNANATMVMGSAGCLAILGTGYAITWPAYSYLDKQVLTAISAALVHVLLFGPGAVFHGLYHTWYDGDGVKEDLDSSDEFSKIREDVRSISRRIDTYESRRHEHLSGTRAEITDMRKSIDELRNGDDDIEQTLDELEGEIDALRDELEDFDPDNDVSELKDKLNGIEDSLERVGDSLD